MEHVLKARKQEVSVWNVISLIHSLSLSTALDTMSIASSPPMPHSHADRHTSVHTIRQTDVRTLTQAEGETHRWRDRRERR